MMEKELVASPSHVEPVLAVNDVLETVTYWHDVLGFPDKWTWGEPPNHGGVAWKGTCVQFSQNARLASDSKGNEIFIAVKKLQDLYEFHQKNKALIVDPLENKPWGMAGYTVQDINGYNIVFAGGLLTDKKERSGTLPSTIKVLQRLPTVTEYQYLTSSVGWSLYADDAVVTKLLAAPVFGVVAEDTATNQLIGCALILGDHASFYYIKDVVVDPAWQGKHIGSALMKELNDWLDTNASNKALVALITPEHMAPFYRQFDYSPAFCMIRYIERNEK